MATPTATGQMQLGYQPDRQDDLLKECRDAYTISNNAYESCIREGQEVIDLFNNRQYTQAQLDKLELNGQPAETYNIVKMFSNAIIGYLDTVVTQFNVEPRYAGSATTALLINDVVEIVLDQNNFETMNKRIKLDGILTGLMVCYEDVINSGKLDQFGRPIMEVKLSHVPSWQVRIDPMSSLDDYSDANFINHFTWLREGELIAMFGEEMIGELTQYYNYLDGDTQADYSREYVGGNQTGHYRQHDAYLIVKTIIKAGGKTWSVIWNDEFVLEQKDISGNVVPFPYRVVKMSSSDISEYYGPFRDITETQKAINQAILQIQLLSNTSKAFVEDNAVENIEEFRTLFGRINAIIPVLDLQGIRVENMSQDIEQQYKIIDQALERVKSVLGISDSFLGSSFASDSGRKVAMQAQSTASQLTSVVERVQFMVKMIGTDVVKLIQQFYKANQIFRMSDPLNAAHYIEINKPLGMPTGQVMPDGTLVTSLVWTEVTDMNGEPVQDDEGAYMMEPMNIPETDIEFSEIDVKIVTSIGQNSDERNQLLMETFVNGPAGQMLMQTNPSGYLKTLAMMVSEFGTKHSLEIARLLMETAIQIDNGQVDPRLAMVGGDLQSLMGAAMGGNNGAGGSPGGTMPSQGSQAPQTGANGPGSPTLGLPQTGGQ